MAQISSKKVLASFRGGRVILPLYEIQRRCQDPARRKEVEVQYLDAVDADFVCYAVPVRTVRHCGGGRFGGELPIKFSTEGNVYQYAVSKKDPDTVTYGASSPAAAAGSGSALCPAAV